MKYASRFTSVENEAGGLFQHPAGSKNLSCRRAVPDRSSTLSTQTLEAVGLDPLTDYVFSVTGINQVAILRSELCWLLFRVTPLEEGEPTTSSIQ